MTCIPFQSSVIRDADRTREVIADGVARISLSRGGHASVDVGAGRVTVDVRRGSIWLTQDAADHVLEAGARFDCAAGVRVVVTALSDAMIDVRREARR